MEKTKLTVDSDILIAHLQDKGPHAKILDRAMQLYDCHTTLINVYELFYGAEYTQKSEDAEALLKSIKILAFDYQVARKAAEIDVKLAKQGQKLDIKDILIASVCLRFGIPILTNNTDHFSRIPNLKVVAPEDIVEEGKTKS